MGRRAALIVPMLLACFAVAQAADPRSDAPDERAPVATTVFPSSYADALRAWRNADDLNAWIGARFEYDAARAIALSETQRNAGAPFAIHAPDAFYDAASGVCVDLARFGVETLRVVDPASKPVYLMIEFAPVTVAGAVLRRHWLVAFERGGQRYFFADSKRPGHVAGPYASTRAFLDEYARFRGREIVAFRELDGYERKPGVAAVKRNSVSSRPGQ